MNELRRPVQFDRSRQASPQVKDVLRRRIQSLQLPPGTVLSRAELQKEFGVSQTPIRDALLRLAEDGLVNIFPQHATVVSPIDLNQVRQSQFMRRALEQEVLEALAQNHDAKLLGRLESLLAYQQVLADQNNQEEFDDADSAYHMAMYEAAGMPDIWALIRRQNSHFERFRALYSPPGRNERVISDHRALFESISSSNVAAARKAARDHVSRSFLQMDHIRQQYPAYFVDGAE